MENDRQTLDAPDAVHYARIIEAMLFTAEDMVSIYELKKIIPEALSLPDVMEILKKRYEGAGIELRRIGENYAFRTAADIGPYLTMVQRYERKLSRAAIETLAIIAYHQPCTRAEIEEIRGVSASKGTIDQLLALDWIQLGARRETPGRPVTFLTTAHFLDHFGLQSTKDLPGLKELREAGLLESRSFEVSSELFRNNEHVNQDNEDEEENMIDEDYE